MPKAQGKELAISSAMKKVMDHRKNFAFLLFALLLLSSAATPQDTSQTSLDWHGTYKGILPCADCEGVKTVLTIRQDHTYLLEITYLGKAAEPLTYEGSFAWAADGGTIYLNDLSDRPNRFFIGENFVSQLDLEGQRVTGALEDQYKLNKVQVPASP